MADLDPFEVVRRLRNAPLGPVVEALRRIHDRGKVEPTNLEELLGWKAAATEEPQQPPRTARSLSPDYEAARRHFVQHSVRLREQAILAEKLLDGLAAHAATPTMPVALTQELRIQCAPGSTSRARFIVANCFERTIDVRFHPGRIHGISPAQAAAVRLSFTPEQPRLEAGSEQQVQLLVEVDDGDLPDVLELGVNVSGDEQILLKLWVRIELRPGGVEWTRGNFPASYPE